MTEIEKAKQIAARIKETIPIDPRLSHTDAFEDSHAVAIITIGLREWAYQKGAIY